MHISILCDVCVCAAGRAYAVVPIGVIRGLRCVTYSSARDGLVLRWILIGALIPGISFLVDHIIIDMIVHVHHCVAGGPTGDGPRCFFCCWANIMSWCNGSWKAEPTANALSEVPRTGVERCCCAMDGWIDVPKSPRGNRTGRAAISESAVGGWSRRIDSIPTSEPARGLDRVLEWRLGGRLGLSIVMLIFAGICDSVLGMM